MNNIDFLPSYRCHKVVKAAPINSFSQDSGRALVSIGSDVGVHIDVPAGFFARSLPAPGDYLVVYDDGYISHSPKAAFEAGYTLMDRTQIAPTVTPDPAYDFVPAAAPAKKGVQCGQCGMKFEYGSAYGYVCQHLGCPLGCGGATC